MLPQKTPLQVKPAILRAIQNNQDGLSVFYVKVSFMTHEYPDLIYNFHATVADTVEREAKKQGESILLSYEGDDRIITDCQSSLLISGYLIDKCCAVVDNETIDNIRTLIHVTDDEFENNLLDIKCRLIEELIELDNESLLKKVLQIDAMHSDIHNGSIDNGFF